MIVAAIVIAQMQDPIDFKLQWKEGEKYSYTHISKNAALKLDASGDFVVTVTKAAPDAFTLSTSEIVYTSNSTMRNTPAGTIKLTPRGVPLPDQPNDPMKVLFVGMNLPTSPIKPGDTYKVPFTMPNVATIDLNGKFEGYLPDKPTIARLVLTGDLPMGRSSTTVKVEQLFDTKRGVFISVSFTVESLSALTMIKLKEK